jgi:hypothetical protein
MSKRLGYVKGDYLVQTDGGGITAHRSECLVQYDGKLKMAYNTDPRHPQEFLRAKKDIQSVPNARPITEPVFKFTTQENF